MVIDALGNRSMRFNEMLRTIRIEGRTAEFIKPKVVAGGVGLERAGNSVVSAPRALHFPAASTERARGFLLGNEVPKRFQQHVLLNRRR